MTVASLALLLACTGRIPEPPGEAAASDLARDTAPDVDSTTLASLTASNRAFALDLYGQLAGADDENLFLSPHSISVAFAMAYAGAETETETEMSQVLHYDLAEPELHAAFNALDLELATRSEVEGSKRQGFELSILNQPFGQMGFGFEADYLDTLALNYGAGLRLLDFAADSELARGQINDWVLDATRDRIDDLLPAGSVSALTRLVLTNAIYFKAAWNDPFEVSNTRDDDFTLLDGATVAASTMHGEVTGTYNAGDGWVLGEVPYLGGDVVMGILLPAEGRFAEIEAAMNGSFVDAAVDGLVPAELSMALPKFTFETTAPLRDPLRAMGLLAPFDEQNADFSGITSETSLYVSGAFHKTFVDVNEEGTEAAAATAIVADALSAGPPPAELTIDRPFVFWIRDRPTGALLFLGRVTDPR